VLDGNPLPGSMIKPTEDGQPHEVWVVWEKNEVQ
jgi:hypothetical protein